MLAPALALIFLVGQAPAPAPAPVPAPGGGAVGDDVIAGPTVVAVDFAALDELAGLIAAAGPGDVARLPRFAALVEAGRLFELPGPSRFAIREIGVCPHYRDDGGRPIPVYSGRLLDGPRQDQAVAVFPTQLASTQGAAPGGGGRPGDPEPPGGPLSLKEKAEEEARLLARFRTIHKESQIAEARAIGRIKEPPGPDRERALVEAARQWRAEIVERFALGADADLELIREYGRAIQEQEDRDRRRRVEAKRRAKGQVGQELAEIGQGLSAQLAGVLRQSAIAQARREAAALNILRQGPR